jgi:hypothetical protein
MKKNLFLVTLLSLSQFSCIDAPVEITLGKPIVITEQDYSQIQELKNEVLKQLDLGQATTKKSCNDAFSHWLDEQLKAGFVPKRHVTPLEYGKNNADPRIGQCHTVDLSKQIPEAWQRLIQQNKIVLSSDYLDIIKFRQTELEGRACLEDFLSPDAHKISLISMNTVIQKNTLNITAPIYNIYYTTTSVTEADSQKPNAERDLLASGAIKYFGHTQAFKPGFKGPLDIIFSSNIKEKQAAIAAFTTLKSNLIAYPQTASLQPEMHLRAGQSFYVIPKGEAQIKLEIDLLINLTLGNARCFIQKHNEL